MVCERHAYNTRNADSLNVNSAEDINHRGEWMKKIELNRLSHDVSKRVDCDVSAANTASLHQAMWTERCCARVL